MKIISETAARVLAAAICELYPAAKIIKCDTHGLVFTCDFHFSKQVDEEMLHRLHDRMMLMCMRKQSIETVEMVGQSAKAYFHDVGSHKNYDVFDDKELLTFFKMGDFLDRGDGPFLSDTSKIKFLKLLKIVNLYKHVYRIEGVITEDKNTLRTIIKKIKSYEENSHIKVGYELDLFKHTQDYLCWLPDGIKIKSIVVEQIQSLLNKEGYGEIVTSHDCDLIKRRGLHEQLLKQLRLKGVYEFFTWHNINSDDSSLFSLKYTSQCVLTSIDNVSDGFKRLLMFFLKLNKIFNLTPKIVCYFNDETILKILFNAYKDVKIINREDMQIKFFLTDGLDEEHEVASISKKELLYINKFAKNDSCIMIQGILPIESYIAFILEKSRDSFLKKGIFEKK